MEKTRLMVVGGFLGAGKTTSIIAIAKELISSGKKIAIVTNDQGSKLIDSKYMAQQGLNVLEVAGGCFCGNFDAFTKKLAEVEEQFFPDIVLVEPVGSCADLIATVMKPLKKGYAGKFALSPLSVVVDPKRLKRVIKDENKLFKNDINYLFEKQINEADVIALNKIDTLTDKEIGEYTEFLKKKFPAALVIAVSSFEKIGIENWIEKISSACEFKGDSLDIKYDVYTTAERHLGWLNTTAGIDPLTDIDANEFVYEFAEILKDNLKSKYMEIAHLKMYLVASNDYVKLSATSVYDESNFDKKMAVNCGESSLIINIRAQSPAQYLKEITENTLKILSEKYKFNLLEVQTEAFNPKYTVPLQRID